MAGAFAGACARLVTAPFDVLKIRFQLQFAEKVKYTSLSQAFRTSKGAVTSLAQAPAKAPAMTSSFVELPLGILL